MLKLAGVCYLMLNISILLSLETRNNFFELIIVHYSDFHGRFIPIAPDGGFCYDQEKCVGGIARVSTIVHHLKQQHPNAILLNAGDCFQGTLYYDIYRDNITAYFMNKLPHDAITIGNHDFDDEICGLASFMNELRAPKVLTNLDSTDEYLLQNLYTNSTVILKSTKGIGVIGVITSDTDKISKYTGKLKFLNAVETINLEAKKLKFNGINIIIVLSHCGIAYDKIIAANCPDVDVIVGGHSHILLYNGIPPSNEIPYDRYPIVITQTKYNRKVLIVHSGAFTKYMGNIRIVFDENDEVKFWKGNPIYLDSNVKEDCLIIDELQSWKAGVDRIGKEKIGQALVFLNNSCDSGECNLANLITDAMVYKYNSNASISLINANSIQSSIPAGPILYENIYMVAPYNNTWDLIELQGKYLLEALEENVAASSSNTSFINSKLLHWSGLKVTYNLTNNKDRVIDVKVRCFHCLNKVFEALEPHKRYPIVIPSYIVSNTIIKKQINKVIGKTSDLANIVNYIKKIDVVDIGNESRMIFV
ncbi:PREDICTED: apyrase-like [Ceratosolen solmsi marchali]|uniref:Apyrase-like n=1 Tax=Ceratosolen solmsi marchali TaxID=326594 RepID=A0AAJ6YNF9_9HYME|nr:PREDICTED: apyrase-like [Ceratosolen solmsi marchali]